MTDLVTVQFIQLPRPNDAYGEKVDPKDLLQQQAVCITVETAGLD